MLKAYIDDSVEDGRVLIMGGFVAAPKRWERFSDEWRAYLKHARIPFFHMHEMWIRKGNEELWEHMPWFYGVIKDHVQGVITVAIPIEPLERVFAESGLKNYVSLKNPYFWAIRGIVNWTARYQSQWGSTSPIDFIFDERKEKKIVRQVWNFYKENIPTEVQQLTGREPQFEDDQQILPLQAADMWAWWCRKQWMEKGTILTTDCAVPWGRPGDIPLMSFEWSEADMRIEFAKLLKSVDEVLGAKGFS